MTKLRPYTNYYLLILLTLSTITLYGQTESSEFKRIQKELVGCWHSKYYQFKYDSEKNLGSEYQSRVRSSAPIFKLIEKNDGIYFEWIELTGGEHFQKVIWIKKNKIKMVNEDGSKNTYKRNKDCK